MNLHTLLLTKNNCYKAAKPLTPKGVMIHSTGANNPWLKRYVGPDDGLLGKNTAGNHWNQPKPGGRSVCTHAFIGKLADGSIATYQTLPWNYEGWHCGEGKKGSANHTHIGFEICEDGLSNKVYFNAVYREAVEFTAHLCTLFKLNPKADGVVICHSEGYARGVASNHSDVMHWFAKHGKTMDDFRADVAQAMGRAPSEPDQGDKDKPAKMTQVSLPVLSKGSRCGAVLAAQILLYGYGYDPKGKDGNWGPGMDKAFRKWQEDNGLKADGSLGPASWTRLICGG